MYTITYRNVLKPDKDIHDFRHWLNGYWSVCRSWGAQRLRLWRFTETGKNIVLWQITVGDIGQWHDQFADDHVRTILTDLEHIVDIDQLGIRVINNSRIRQYQPLDLFGKISLN
ncbi:hypothetical protein JW948_07555 [bacterium]|nr:hypothetical protein [bacterium]